MAQLTEVMFTIEQTAEHALLKTVRIGYAYTIEGAEAGIYEVAIDILGDDIIRDDKLALAADPHQVDCTNAAPARTERSIMVGQALLDEDIGTDEIKLRINATAPSGEVISAMTPIIRGNF